MIMEYRQRVIRTLNAISGIGDIRDMGAGLGDREMLNKLEKKGYLSHYELTSKGRGFHKKLHQKQSFGGPEGNRRYEKEYNYWAKTVQSLAESSEASQRNIDLGLIVMSC